VLIMRLLIKKIIYCVDNEIVDEQQEIVSQIDNLVLDLGRFSWEIAPGKKKPWAFTISPNGDKKLLEQSRNIINSAPELNKWEFNYSKPAKDWDRKFSLYDENVDLQEIDASSWKFVAITGSDKKMDLLIEGPNISYLDTETAKLAAEQVVLNEIGEEARILYVSSIKIEFSLQGQFAKEKKGINLMKQLFLNPHIK